MRARLGRSSPEARLREAIAQDEFSLMYLPVVEVGTNKIVGVEALLRWSDPSRGVVTPSEFLRTLDDSGLIVPLGRWILETACVQNKEWSARFPDLALVTTVNFSPRQLMQSDLGEMVRGVVEFTGVDPGRICLEITEGVPAATVEEAWSALRPVRELGIQLALDDFGMGYSSLEFLRQFQLDVLKIDRSLVAAAATSRTDAAIVEQMVNLAHALDIAPVAEGVSTKEEAGLLEGVRCDFAQGYWFSPPRTVQDMSTMLERGMVMPGATRT
jgi:diguanylate cyclase